MPVWLGSMTPSSLRPHWTARVAPPQRARSVLAVRGRGRGRGRGRPVIGKDMVRVGSAILGVSVDESGRQPRNGMQQVVLGADRDLVSLDGGDVRADDHFALGADLVPDPAQPYLADIQHAESGAQGALGLVDERRV